jgi:DNA polymerase III epsilon subunit-like protein
MYLIKNVAFVEVISPAQIKHSPIKIKWIQAQIQPFLVLLRLQQNLGPSMISFSPANNLSRTNIRSSFVFVFVFFLAFFSIQLDSNPEFRSTSSTTLAAPSTPQAPHILAIDCEMVVTINGYELARVTVLASDGQMIYDKFVKPKTQILDYCTEFSGITAEKLSNVTTRLSDVQQELLETVTPDTILVGHSLENDLQALKIVHKRVLDTALLYPHPRGHPYKQSLKFLARRFLERDIQTSGAQGHDSAEDARAALDLALLKLKNGPAFGVVQSASESLFAVLQRYNVRCAMTGDAHVVQEVRSPHLFFFFNFKNNHNSFF